MARQFHLSRQEAELLTDLLMLTDDPIAANLDGALRHEFGMSDQRRELEARGVNLDQVRREYLQRLIADSGVASGADLGPLPEPDMSHRKALDDCDEESSYSAEAMEAERQRCYERGAQHERERCARICEQTYVTPGDLLTCTCQDAADAIRGAAKENSP